MVKVNTDFEAGSITLISADTAADILLALKEDNASSAKQWFYFSVSTQMPCTHGITIVNASEASFVKGWVGYDAFASYDQETWFRVPTNYTDGKLHFELEATSERVYYAYFVPYTSVREQRLSDKLQTSEGVDIQTLTTTPHGNHLHLVSIGDTYKYAKQIWIIARQHPGETMAQWMAEGIIRALHESYLKSPEKFKNIHFNIVPNMNPDGSMMGNHRTNAQGMDLNRQWGNPCQEKSPEVYAARQKMRQTGVDLFIDLHGDEAIPHNFIMVEQQNAFGERFKKSLAEMSTLFQTQYDYSSYATGCGATSCGTSCGAKKATAYVADKHDAVSMLLEGAFKELETEGVGQHWDHFAAISLGEEIADLMLSKVNLLY